MVGNAQQIAPCLSNVQFALLAACRGQEGTVDTQLLQTAASGFAELMSSDLRLFKACPELQSTSSASSSISLSDVLGSQQYQGGAGSTAVTPDGAAAMDSQAWFTQNEALELALGGYMHAEEGFGQAHTEVNAALAVHFIKARAGCFPACLPS